MELSHVSHQLLLIRHAQSQNNANEEQARICDPGITDLGRQQAESLSKFLSSMVFESIICSAFRRALQTAEHLNSTLGKPSEVLIDLHEHGGCYEGWHSENFVGMPGMTDTEIEAEFSNVVFPDDYPADGWWQSKPRETHDQSIERAERMANILADRYSAASANVACVTHADFLAKLLVAMFGSEIENETAFFDLKNVGITRVIFDGNRWQFLEVNSVDFLPVELVSS